MLGLRSAKIRLLSCPQEVSAACVRVCVCVWRMCSAVWAASFVIQSSLQRLCNHVNRTKTIPLESLIDFTGMVCCHSKCHNYKCLDRLLSALFSSSFRLRFSFSMGSWRGRPAVLVFNRPRGPVSINCDCPILDSTKWFHYNNSWLHLPTDSPAVF